MLILPVQVLCANFLLYQLSYSSFLLTGLEPATRALTAHVCPQSQGTGKVSYGNRTHVTIAERNLSNNGILPLNE